MRFQSAHSRVLEEGIRKRRQEILEGMAAGVSEVLYHQLVGEVRGLDNALALSDEADSKLNGDHIADR